MKIWVDDLREPPDEGWTWVQSSSDAIWLLRSGPLAEELSLDHDLGGEDTSRPAVLWLCEHEYRWPLVVRVHSANPVGRAWLEGMIERYQP